MKIYKSIIGAIATLVVGGGVYSVRQADVVNNFAANTGMTQEQAQKYVSGIDQSSLTTFDKVGASLVSDGNLANDEASKIDCENYQYEWETKTLTCIEGKRQLSAVGQGEITLGKVYEKLNSDSATKDTMTEAINDIDALSSLYKSEVIKVMLDVAAINDITQTNAYNKSILQAAIQGK